MTKDELLKALRELKNCQDAEKAHGDADGLLLAWIDDEEIEDAYEAIEKYYA